MVAVSFIGGGNQSTQEKTTDLSQTLSHNVVLSTPCPEGFELTLVVIGTDCIGSYKSNYHTITTMMGPGPITMVSWKITYDKFEN